MCSAHKACVLHKSCITLLISVYSTHEFVLKEECKKMIFIDCTHCLLTRVPLYSVLCHQSQTGEFDCTTCYFMHMSWQTSGKLPFAQVQISLLARVNFATCICGHPPIILSLSLLTYRGRQGRESWRFAITCYFTPHVSIHLIALAAIMKPWYKL